MDKKLMLNQIKEHLSIKTNAEFARFLGIKANVLSNWYSRNTFDVEILYTKCEFLNPAWLITGDGGMLNVSSNKPEPKKIAKEPQASENANSDLHLIIKEKDKQLIELSEKIGELKYQIKQLRKGNGYNIAAEPE